MAFIMIRKLDSAVIGVNKYSNNPISSDSWYELNKESFPDFTPHWSKTMWTYSSLSDSFTDTGLPMVWL